MVRFTVATPAIISACLAALSVAPVLAQQSSYRPSFQPDRLKGPPAGKPNEVMVLGSPHLSGLPKSFQPATLAPLIDRLAGWRPTAIAVEHMSGLQCDSLRRYPSRYAGTVENYCPDPSEAGRAIGMDVPAANAEAERMLAAWPKAPTPAQRRRLATVFLAAGEQDSALVQWLRLPPGERRADDGLTESLATALTKRAVRRDEVILIAVPLAVRLGLDRLWSVDDHSADTPDPADGKAYEAAIRAAWDNPATRERSAKDQRAIAGLSRPDGLMNLYRAFNAPALAPLIYRSDFGAALVEPSRQGFGRGYVGYWETRNLRMVANMRDILGQYPGTRMLTIVGVSHKAYYEAYLNQMHDVTLVDPTTVLK